MTIRQVLAISTVLAGGGLIAGCGDAEPQATTTVTTTATVTTTTTVTTPTTTTGTTTTPRPVTLEQPAIWPAPGVEFTGAQRAARDFVAKALEVPVNLGPYQAGDARSGEIEVRFAGEGGDLSLVRGVLLLRQLGPRSTWYVLAAVNDNAAITSPASASAVPAGRVTVTGNARGFEGAVSVTAFVAGNAARKLDQAVITAGSMADPEPFSVTLDLTAARSGQTVVLLVRGGVGLETDPGDFGAVPVVIK